MYGAIIGDIVGSIYEFHNIKTKNFPLFSPQCEVTDDTIMTVAVAKAIIRAYKENAQGGNAPFLPMLVAEMQAFGKRYPNPMGAYGGRFAQWLRDPDPQPYESFGNGSAMRVSPAGIVAVTLEEAQILARAVSYVTHNHPEGIKGAEATAAAMFLAKSGASREEIRAYIAAYYYDVSRSVDEIRKTYRFNETCQKTVPEALTAFFESESFEDAIRNCISIGGDSDTIGAITGAVAWSYYGHQQGAASPSPDMQQIKAAALPYIPQEFVDIAEELRALAETRHAQHLRDGSCGSILSPDEYAFFSGS